jgi:predicted nuclease of predicted toxin-antitoxin system
MTFLVDENLALSFAEALRQIGIPATHVMEIGLNQTDDEVIVDYAKAHEMVIITFDLDLTRIVAMSRRDLPTVITFRLGQISQKRFVDFFQEYLPLLQPSIEKGALITVDDNGIRIKELPIGR